ncbi:MAG TPA: NADPH-dependent FMN reductase [Gemmatimonadaceae bacterium]
MPQLLTISGSLRTGSTNSTLLAAAARVAPSGIEVRPYAELAALPAFSPDLEQDATTLPPAVAHWRAALAAADAVLISSPEYAHGIPGAFKNALDWVVGSGELVDKRVGLICPSVASQFAHPQIVEVLTTMSAVVLPSATVVIDLPRRGVEADRLANDPVVASVLRGVILELFDACSI